MVTIYRNTPQVLVGAETATEGYTSIATLADGGYVVAWVGTETRGSLRSETIYARRYDAQGNPSAVFRVDSDNSTGSTFTEVQVVGLEGGGFAFAWTEHRRGTNGSTPDPNVDSSYIQWRGYDEDGVPQYSNQLGSIYPADPSLRGFVGTSIAAKDDGGFRVATYDDRTGSFLDLDIAANGSRSFEPSIVTETQPFGNARDISAIGSRPDGGHVIAWVGSGADGDGDGDGIFFQIVRADGGIVKAKTQVNVANIGSQNGVELLELDGGRFNVVWTSAFDGIRMQRYQANGERIGGEITVSTGGFDPDVTRLSDGGFVIVWDGDFAVYAQRFDAIGKRVGDTILVDDARLSPTTPSVTALDGGAFVVTWRTGDLANQDIFSRTFRNPTDGGAMTGAIENVAGTAANDVILANPGSLGPQDVIFGGGGVDRIQLTAPGTLDLAALDSLKSVERLYGSSGNDTFIVSNNRLSEITAASLGGGVDTFRYVGAGSAESFVLEAGFDVDVMRPDDPDSLLDHRFTGNAYAQTIFGNAGDNVVRGEGGHDKLSGFAGNDTIYGGSGNDMLTGGPGTDTLYGETGNDTYFVETNADQVRESAGQGFDTVLAAASFGLVSSAEIEVLKTQNAAGTASIELRGSDFAQTIEGNAGANRLSGRGGDDKLHGLAGNDRLDGGEGNDSLYGGAGKDTMNGGNGSDDYYVDRSDVVSDSGASGIDTVIASAGYTLTVGSGIENLRAGTAASQNLTGNELANEITGNAGRDVLRGGAGADTLKGLDGNDTLAGGTGADTLYGGAGNDTFQFAAGDGVDTVMGFLSGTDEIDLTIFPGSTGAPASAYREIKVMSDDFFELLAAADAQMTGAVKAVFVAGNSNGWLFWSNNGADGTPEEAILLAGRNALTHFGVGDLV